MTPERAVAAHYAAADLLALFERGDIQLRGHGPAAALNTQLAQRRLEALRAAYLAEPGAARDEALRAALGQFFALFTAERAGLIGDMPVRVDVRGSAERCRDLSCRLTEAFQAAADALGWGGKGDAA